MLPPVQTSTRISGSQAAVIPLRANETGRQIPVFLVAGEECLISGSIIYYAELLEEARSLGTCSYVVHSQTRASLWIFE